MKTEKFRKIAAEAVDALPDEFQERMDNVDILVEPRPSAADLREAGVRGGTLLGLYRGIPLDSRGTSYGCATPDVIVLYQEPIEAECGSPEQVRIKISEVLLHEIGHHFGMEEEEMP